MTVSSWNSCRSLQTRYDIRLSAEFSGTVGNFPFTGWSRQTTVTRIGGPSLPNDFTRITVAVTAPSLDSAVERTITVAAER